MELDPFTGVMAWDIETASACDIKYGAWAYSQHESTRVWCVVFGYATAAGVYNWWSWRPGAELPSCVVNYLGAGGPLIAHNASFERSILLNILQPRYGFPTVDETQWRDTQAMGLALNLPMSLDGLTKALGCPTKKDKEGAALMKAMATLRLDEDSGTWVCGQDTPENRKRLEEYCLADVYATLDAWFRMPNALPLSEHVLWQVDQRINARGIYLDKDFARRCLKSTEARRAELGREALRATGGQIHSASHTPAVKAWIEERGIELPKRTRKRADGSFAKSSSLDAAAVAELLDGDALPADIRATLELRVEANKATSLAKLQRVGSMVGIDGRLYNALQYCGANTGRWTSSGLQVHNLPKEQSAVASDVAYWLVQNHGLSTLKLFEARPLEALSKLLRSVIVAPPGRELIAADFSAIEARVLSWLVDDRDVLDVFADYDAGTGPDVYVFTAAAIGSTNRQLGKVMRLALGYGMGAIKFADTAAKYGIPLDLKTARAVQKGYRETNPLVVRFWRELEDAFREAIAKPGKRRSVGRVSVALKGSCMFMFLPSGRAIRYWKPRVRVVTKRIKTVTDEGVIVEREYETEEIQFYSMGPNKTDMLVDSTYGGKLVENATQAVARDLLGAALVRLDGVDPYELIVHVHDSIAAEVPKGAGSVDEFCALMAERPAWAADLPVAVDGYRDTRFHG